MEQGQRQQVEAPSPAEETVAEESPFRSGIKFAAAGLLLVSTVSTLRATFTNGASESALDVVWSDHPHRRLASLAKPGKDYEPTYITPILDELKERKKLMEETPPEEVKYWFEYAGPLQKYFYRFSKSRGKADYFEGRDDSGVSSARFVEELGGSKDFADFFNMAADVPDEEISSHSRLLDNCLAMGSAARPSVDKGTFWYDWFGSPENESKVLDRCRILFTVNTVGSGRGPTILWETAPPTPHTNGPKPWQSEQETAATHLERNLREIDAMCASGQIAARVQILVCEPIPGEWTDWMDAQLVHCGGKPAPLEGIAREKEDGAEVSSQVAVEDRPSPVQVVVVSSAATADTCHDLKSGFMEKRMQDIVLAPPLLEDEDVANKQREMKYDSSVKTTHPDLISSDHHDLYVAMKWSSMVTLRSISAFLQASADLGAAAASPNNNEDAKTKNIDSVISSSPDGPTSPFLVPSFVRVSYVSEENNKVAKWRMHGDFFHPAAWELCKDSFDMTWIPDSLSSTGGINGVCYGDDVDTTDCGQWWVFMAEEQMPTSPEVFANEVTAPLVEGGSNFFWMLTERQRREMVDKRVCEHVATSPEEKKKCAPDPQAIIPLGDLESFLINYMPNTSLGKKHESGRRPGYTVEAEREADREKVRERKQLKGQEDIEKALFDYTIYPAALFHKDATIKAARAVDAILSMDKDDKKQGLSSVKSSYYDVTIIKPREATLGWCQNISRRGLCSLYAEYFRESNDERCHEACGMKKYFTSLKN